MGAFQRFKPYVRKQRSLYIVSFIGSLFRFLIPLAVPLVMKYLFDELLPNEALTDADRLRQLFVIGAAVLAAFFLVRGPMEYVRQYFLHKANNNIVKALRADAFRKVHTLDAKYFADHKSGEIGTRLLDDVEKLRGYMTALYSNLWIELTVLAFVVGMMLTMHAKLTLLAVALVGAQFALAHLFSKRLKLATQEMMRGRSVLSGFIFEKIQGAFLAKLFSAERKDREELDRHLARYEQATDRQARVNAASLAVVNVLSDATPILVVMFGSLLILDGSLTLGALTAFFAYVDRMRSPVSALVGAFPAIAEGRVAMERVFGFLEQEAAIREKDSPHALREFKDRVVFRDVSFGYRTGREIIAGLSFTLQKGKTYAFVGESGGGKSTILHLLTRMYDADRGEVLVDGRNVKDLALSDLRKLTGVATQDSFLYSASIGDNIRIGKLDASDEEVVAAAKKAHAHEFISSLPDGYDTEIGERGVKLSGGQRQRIALARVFLKQAPILLLDEATSALDNESEKLVLRSIRRIGRDATVIMIAHRLSTVLHADTIFVLRGGRIVESGSHDALMEAGGYYRALYAEQQSAEVPGDGPSTHERRRPFRPRPEAARPSESSPAK